MVAECDVRSASGQLLVQHPENMWANQWSTNTLDNADEHLAVARFQVEAPFRALYHRPIRVLSVT